MSMPIAMTVDVMVAMTIAKTVAPPVTVKVSGFGNRIHLPRRRRLAIRFLGSLCEHDLDNTSSAWRSSSQLWINQDFLHIFLWRPREHVETLLPPVATSQTFAL